MGKLAEHVNSTLVDINNYVVKTLSEINDYNDEFESHKLYTDYNDPDLLKERMKNKIRMGINSYDN